MVIKNTDAPSTWSDPRGGMHGKAMALAECNAEVVITKMISMVSARCMDNFGTKATGEDGVHANLDH